MPEHTYDLRLPADEAPGPVQLQVVAFDAEGENLGGVSVRLEVDEGGSFEADRLVTRLTVVTGARGRAYFVWAPWPRDGATAGGVAQIKATWEGTDPFVFIERARGQGAAPPRS